MRAEYAAVSARLSADSALTVRDTVYDSSGALYRGQYVVLFGGAPDELDDQRYSHGQATDSRAVYVYTARCVAITPDGVRSVLEHVMTQLVGFTPIVAGRKCWAITMTRTQDPAPDTSVQPPLYFCDTEFTLVSDRA